MCATFRGVYDVVSPPPQSIAKGGVQWERTRSHPRPMRSRDGGCDASPMKETLRDSRSGRPNLYAPIQAEYPCRTVLDDVNAILLQYTLNLLNILHIHASNTDTALDLTVTVLNDLKLKRDTVQTENDLPAQ